MARGKHAAKTAARVAHASEATIARLEAELAEAKARARSAESAAKRTAALDAELARLRRDLEDSTSDTVRRLQERIDHHHAETEALLDRVAAEFAHVAASLVEAGGRLEFEQHDALRDLLGASRWGALMSNAPGISRAARRVLKKPGLSVASEIERHRQARRNPAAM